MLMNWRILPFCAGHAVPTLSRRTPKLNVRRGVWQWGPVLHVHPGTGETWMFYTESPIRRCYRPKTIKFPPRCAACTRLAEPAPSRRPV